MDAVAIRLARRRPRPRLSPKRQTEQFKDFAEQLGILTKHVVLGEREHDYYVEAIGWWVEHSMPDLKARYERNGELSLNQVKAMAEALGELASKANPDKTDRIWVNGERRHVWCRKHPLSLRLHNTLEGLRQAARAEMDKWLALKEQREHLKRNHRNRHPYG